MLRTLASSLALGAVLNASAFAACVPAAKAGCYQSFQLAGNDKSRVHYLASMDGGTRPTKALVVIHGYRRDANITYSAAMQAVTGANASETTLVIAPVFQVGSMAAGKCSTLGVPSAQTGDLLWTCGSWQQGGESLNGMRPTSFAVLDELLEQVKLRWPSVRLITVAGFSAGAQMVQHYIGFSRVSGIDARVRYVVADPGTWLYFDAVRVQPTREADPADGSECFGNGAKKGRCAPSVRADNLICPTSNLWKYGTDGLPRALDRTAAAARNLYAAADISYLEGELDSSASKGAFYKILDKSCAANLQGPYRLQRGLAYVQYDNTVLAPTLKRKLTVVPGCAHDVTCVFTSKEAQRVLVGPPL